jgi:HSP20 family molecular chaperone IbpA
MPRVRTVIRERSVSAVRRSLQLPDRVTGEGIVAELENGVLTVRLPYAARPTPRKISVN